MLVTNEIQQTIGATNLETDILNFLANTLTGNDPQWSSDVGDGSGAWGVSERWYGVVTPRDSVLAQAGQALIVLRFTMGNLGSIDEWPGPVCFYSAVLKLWWFPGEIGKIRDYKALHGVYPRASDLGWDDMAAKRWFVVSGSGGVADVVKNNWPWIVAGLAVAALVLWLLVKGKK